jgi:hypothetical protein
MRAYVDILSDFNNWSELLAFMFNDWSYHASASYLGIGANVDTVRRSNFTGAHNLNAFASVNSAGWKIKHLLKRPECFFEKVHRNISHTPAEK